MPQSSIYLQGKHNLLNNESNEELNQEPGGKIWFKT